MYHVPSFFFISFFFLFPTIKLKKKKKMVQRLERLSISYFIWPLITFIINNIAFYCFRKSRFNRALTLNELLVQWITGRKIFFQFWFLFNLLFLTIIFFILSLVLSAKYFLKTIKLICIICFILQYSSYTLINLYFYIFFI